MKSIAKSKYKTINQLITEAYEKMNEAANPNGTIDDKSRYKELCRLSSKFLADRILDCLSNRKPHSIGIPDNGQFFIRLTTSKYSTASKKNEIIVYGLRTEDKFVSDTEFDKVDTYLNIVLKYCKSHYDELINTIFHKLYDNNCLKIKSDIDGWGRKIIAFYLNKNLDIGSYLYSTGYDYRGEYTHIYDFPIIIIDGLIFTEKETYLKHNLNLGQDCEEYYLKDHSANIRRAKSDAFRKNLSSPKFPDKQRDDEDEKHTEEEYQD